MLMVEFSTPLREIVRKYVPTTSLNETKAIVDNLRMMGDDRLFRVEQAWYVSADCEATQI